MKRLIILPLALALLSFPVQAAKVDPAYKLQALPEKPEEADLWERATRHENRLRNEGTLFHNRQIEAYLESLADRMLGDSLDHLGLNLDFVLVAEPHLSGWAYPYGTIGLHTGLIVRMDNEAQLAAIVAHEISHFLQRHTYSELIVDGRQSAVGKGLGFLASLALAKETGSFDPNVMDFAGDLWTNLATSGYSQKNEYVADEEGLILMSRAGLSIEQSIPAFQALAENAAYGAGDPRKMWSSHPRLEDRIKNLQKEIKSLKRKKDFVDGMVPEADDYYRNIAPALLINAKLDMQVQQFVRAREALEKYLLVKPDDPEAHFLAGETYRRANPTGPDFSEPLTAYRNALEVDPGYADAYKEIGMAYRMQGQNAAAAEAFEQYLALAADAPDAGIVRGYLEGLR
ncbi:MAG: M48 family metalloprotease [Woeseiaceae bacterium]|nr:M48 family metalloprotease [Woeseiaceae bacterium]